MLAREKMWLQVESKEWSDLICQDSKHHLAKIVTSYSAELQMPKKNMHVIILSNIRT